MASWGSAFVFSWERDGAFVWAANHRSSFTEARWVQLAPLCIALLLSFVVFRVYPLANLLHDVMNGLQENVEGECKKSTGDKSVHAAR